MVYIQFIRMTTCTCRHICVESEKKSLISNKPVQFRTVLPSRGDFSLPWQASLSDWSSPPSDPACAGRTTPATHCAFYSSPGTQTAGTSRDHVPETEPDLVSSAGPDYHNTSRPRPAFSGELY